MPTVRHEGRDAVHALVQAAQAPGKWNPCRIPVHSMSNDSQNLSSTNTNSMGVQWEFDGDPMLQIGVLTFWVCLWVYVAHYQTILENHVVSQRLHHWISVEFPLNLR